MISTWNALAGTMVSAVLNSLFVAFVLVIGAHLLMRLARGTNAATRHVVWWMVLTAVLAAVPARTVVDWIAEASTPPVRLAPVEIVVAEPEPLPAAVPNVSVTPENDGIRAGYWPLFVIAVAAMAFVLQCARVAWSYLYLRRLKARGTGATGDLKIGFDEWAIACGVKRPVRLLISDDVESPIAIGFRTPAVIVPRPMVERMSAEDLDHMLLHELAHLARRDDWTNLFARLLWGALALHPIAAWVLRRIDDEREVACDDWVVGVTGGAREYAVSLSRLMEFRLGEYKEMLATGIGGRKSQFGDRIERLLRSASEFDTRTSLTRAACAAGAFVAIVIAGTQLPAWVVFAQEAPPTPPVPVVAPSAPAVEAPPAAPTPVRSARAKRVPTPPAPPAPAAPPQPSSPGSFLQALGDAGYRDLSVDEIIELKNNGVSAAFLAAVNQAGWGRLSTRQVVDLRRHGVQPEYLKAIKEAGFQNLTMEDAIKLRNHGVRAETVREIHALGFGPYDVRQTVELTNHGIRPDFLKALKDAGYGNSPLKEIVEARQQGVNASNLAEAKKYGGSLTLQQVIRLRQAGVI